MPARPAALDPLSVALSGDLRTVDLPEVFQWIDRGQKTGTLELERQDIRKWIIFSDGHIASSASNDPRERLGQYLLRDRLISEDELIDALLRQDKEDRSLGTILIADGKVTSEQLLRALREKAEETVYDLFLWSEGAFRFRDGDVPKTLAVRLSLHITGVILEGARRADEWVRIRRVIPSGRTTFVPTGRQVADPTAQRIVALAAAGKPLASIAFELRCSDFAAASALYRLVTANVLEPGLSSTGGTSSSQASTLDRLIKRGHQMLAAHQLDDARRSFETALLLDPINIVAKKGLLAVIEERAKPQPLPDVPLDAVPRLARDLASLTDEKFDSLSGFVLSRINGTWTVRAILKLCPVPEEQAMEALARLVQRGVVAL